MAKCKNCGAELQSGAKFCMECGTPVPQVICCSKCGAELSATAKFCPECGTPVFQNSNNTGNTSIKEKIHTVHEPVDTQVLCDEAVDYYYDKKFNKAVNIFKQIADEEVEAQYFLGLCYRDGEGVEANYLEAVNWLEKAADEDLPDAQRELGLMYLQKKFGIENIDKAVKYLNEASQQGDATACSNLAGMYYCGKGVREDRNESYRLYQQASDDDDTIAMWALGNFYYEGNPVKQDTEKAYKFYKSAYKKGFDLGTLFEYDEIVITTGLHHYAEICLEGSGRHADFSLGLTCYKKLAEDYKDSKAVSILASLKKDKGGVRTIDSYGEKILADGNGFIYSKDKKTITGLNTSGGSCKFDDTIKSITIPNGVETIGKELFKYNWNLEEVILPDSVITIAENAFNNCKNLNRVKFGNSLQTIGKGAFAQCEKLQKIEFVETLTSIGEEAFYFCGLKEVKFGESLQTIGKRAFHSNRNLEVVDFGNGESIKSIGDNAFGGCNIKNMILSDTTLQSRPEAFGQYADVMREERIAKEQEEANLIAQEDELLNVQQEEEPKLAIVQEEPKAPKDPTLTEIADMITYIDTAFEKLEWSVYGKKWQEGEITGTQESLNDLFNKELVDRVSYLEFGEISNYYANYKYFPFKNKLKLMYGDNPQVQSYLESQHQKECFQKLANAIDKVKEKQYFLPIRRELECNYSDLNIAPLLKKIEKKSSFFGKFF